MRRAWFILLLLAPPGAAVGAEIVPHEAKYDITLESLETEGFALEADGVMAVRRTRDCQKWESLREMRFNVSVEEGEPVSIHMLVRMLEGLDGKRMEFTGWQTTQGGNRTNLRGTAAMNRDGYGGMASFQKPEETDWDLPSPTKLPMAAMKELLDGLADGRTDPQSIMFEVLGVSEVIRIDPGKAVNFEKIETDDISLVKGRSWLIERAIYFETIERNEPFMFETLQIHANGVVSKFWHDYKTMILSGELVALEEISRPDC